MRTRIDLGLLGRAALAPLLLIAQPGCVGTFDVGGGAGGGGGPGGSNPGGPGGFGTWSVGESGARRLTRFEYDNVIRDLLGDDARAGQTILPDDIVDGLDPFDNNYRAQVPSQTEVDGAEALAQAASDRLFADSARRDQVIGCSPTGPDDAKCLSQFIARFGRRALRRPLSDAEVAELAAFGSFSIDAKDFYVGAGMALRALLQDPELLYRIETGAPVAGSPGIFQLDQFQVAARLAFLIQGTTPDDALLDAAAAGQLGTPAEVRAQAERLLTADVGKAAVSRFHAEWLGYVDLPEDPALAASMRAETDALLAKVIFTDQTPWSSIFTATQSFLDDALAQNYGLPSPGATPGWVDYGASGRQGLLSHGTFLSVNARFGDTSPTRRGLLVRTRLLCQEIPPPPPNVVTDNPIPPVNGSSCKRDRYAAHSADPACAACHTQLDPIGFGIERFDQQGRYRETDVGLPDCQISDDGEVAGLGKFNGPGGLADLLVSSGTVERCMVTELFRFAAGRAEDPADGATLQTLWSDFASGSRRYDDLVADLVSSPVFAYRREQP